jgi:hypothetical protein
MTSTIFLLLFFVIAVAISNNLEFNATLKTNLIITFFVLISIVFLFFGNIENFITERVFPIMGDGFFNTFVLGIINIYAFEGIVFLYFLPPLLKKPENFKKVAITSIIIHIIYLILAVATVLFMFASLTDVNGIMPLYSSARYLEFGDFFERLESVFLLIWIMSFACYISIASKFSILILKKLFNIKNSKPLVFPFSILILAIALLPKNYAYVKFFETSIYPYIIIGFVFVFCISLLVFANIKKKSQNLKVGD